MSRPTFADTLRLLAVAALLGCAAQFVAAQGGAPVFGTCEVAVSAAPKPAASPAASPAAEANPATTTVAEAKPSVSPATAEEPETSNLRIVAKGVGGSALQRLRFYALRRSVAQVPGINLSSYPRRADYFKEVSKELRDLLEKHRCDTLYCPDLINQYESLTKTVPEFKKAYEIGLEKYGGRERLALDWLMVNFPRKNLRTEFYDSKRRWLEKVAEQAGAVASVMTNEKGEAFFMRLAPGLYHVSNLMPLEEGNLIWDCAVTVPPPSGKELHSATVTMTAPKEAAK
jgi:hypothetical protein